jgi:glycosyltransferase involved in cell wall biosynthesis
MKVQIFEQFHEGHYTTYIQHLLPQLLEQGHEVVVSITPTHAASAAFTQKLAFYQERVLFDTSLAEINSTISLNPKFVVRHPLAGILSVGRMFQLATNLVKAVWREQPDRLVVTSADMQNTLLALYEQAYQMFRRPLFPKHTRTVGIFHYGYSGATETFSDRFKAWMYRKMWQQSPFDHLLLVNPIVYEWIKAHDASLAQRVSLAPDPVSPLQPFEQAAARSYLGLTAKGHYVGFVGAMDHRVAIPELIKAFRSSALDDEHLLLAGKLHPSYKANILTSHADWLGQGKIILIDRYLSAEELSAGYQALDLIALVYHKKPNLSANLLKALMANRPVLVNDFGYTGMMTQRFGIGWACDVSSSAALASTLRQALDGNVCYDRPEILKLKQFHSPDNYAATVVKAIRFQPPMSLSNSYKSWQWVTE